MRSTFFVGVRRAARDVQLETRPLRESVLVPSFSSNTLIISGQLASQPSRVTKLCLRKSYKARSKCSSVLQISEGKIDAARLTPSSLAHQQTEGTYDRLL